MSQWYQPSAPTIKLGQHGSRTQWAKPRTQTRLIGDGEAVGHVSHVLDRIRFCWDCNGFYRRLGLPPGVSRLAVAIAYRQMGGYRSSWLTDAARVLINKNTKRQYDALPLGSFWPDDEALVQSIINQEMEITDPLDWAVYAHELDDDVEIDRDLLLRLRSMLSFLLWKAHSPIVKFAVGQAPYTFAAMVGYRPVAFVSVDTDVSDWEVIVAIAQALQEISPNDLTS